MILSDGLSSGNQWCLAQDAARYTPDNWDNHQHRQQLAH
jgi:hypothetical protein